MTIIKLILVLLLCAPLVFIMWLAVRNLANNLMAQHRRAEQIRQKKERMEKEARARARREAFSRPVEVGVRSDARRRGQP